MHLINIVIPMTWGYKYTDWKSVCRWFNSTSGHRNLVNNYSSQTLIIDLFSFLEPKIEK